MIQVGEMIIEEDTTTYFTYVGQVDGRHSFVSPVSTHHDEDVKRWPSGPYKGRWVVKRLDILEADIATERLNPNGKLNYARRISLLPEEGKFEEYLNLYNQARIEIKEVPERRTA